MKIGNKLSFGIQAVAAGQKSATVNATPQIIANCTAGKFSITAPVSKALNVAVGENIMFLNNIAAVEQAIVSQNEDLMAYAAEQGWDLTTREGQNAAIAALSVWYIAKGQPLFDSKGNALMVSERYTKEDKQKFLDAHKAEMIENLDEEGRATLLARLGVEYASDEELADALTIDDVDSPKIQAVSGSKTATAGVGTGVGRNLNFTDTAIWNALKADLGDAKEKKNRNYKVVLDEVESVPFDNGYENVTVLAYPIEFVEDTDPIQRGTKEA